MTNTCKQFTSTTISHDTLINALPYKETLFPMQRTDTYLVVTEAYLLRVV